MRAVAVALLACAVAAVSAASARQPCYPPGACATQFSTVPFAAAPGAVLNSVTSGGPQVVLQSNAVDVETDGGFVISLPTPPPASPNLPQFDESHGPGSGINRVVAHQRNLITLLLEKISVKKQALADHDTWLEQASRAIERVRKQIRETKLSRAAINRNLKHLEEARKAEAKKVKQLKLAEKLRETQAKLAVLAEQHAAVKRAREAMTRSRERQSQHILELGKKLHLHQDALKQKIQLFEDQENELAQVGQTPQNIRHIDSLLQDDEEARDETFPSI